MCVCVCAPYPKFTQTGVGVVDATGVCAAPPWWGATQWGQGGCWEAWGGTSGRGLRTQHATGLRKSLHYRKIQQLNNNYVCIFYTPSCDLIGLISDFFPTQTLLRVTPSPSCAEVDFVFFVFFLNLTNEFTVTTGGVYRRHRILLCWRVVLVTL